MPKVLLLIYVSISSLVQRLKLFCKHTCNVCVLAQCRLNLYIEKLDNFDEMTTSI